MPFKSKAQLRKFLVMEERGEIPKGTTKRWLKHTKSVKSLPEKKKKKAHLELNLSIWPIQFQDLCKLAAFALSRNVNENNIKPKPIGNKPNMLTSTARFSGFDNPGNKNFGPFQISKARSRPGDLLRRLTGPVSPAKMRDGLNQVILPGTSKRIERRLNTHL